MDRPTLDDILRLHTLWLDGDPAGKCADLRDANLVGTDLRDANLRGANLGDANLVGADLVGADLRRANLGDANLRGANLVGADLGGANLSRANLGDANLRGAYLVCADLRGADLRDANLRGANLRDANLVGANLRGANLGDANLVGADLVGADLRGTCLDPAAPIPAISDEQMISDGLEPRGDRVYGWRTAESRHCGDTAYVARDEPYSAPWFSAGASECHPGIYLAGEDWIRKSYRGQARVRCYCLRAELHRAGDKYRTKRLWIVREEDG